MDEATLMDLTSRIRTAWRVVDPTADVRIRRRDDKLDMVVISSAFAEQDSMTREALFWPAVAGLSRDLLVQMTYSLLLTPDEASRYFANEGPGERTAI